jgi:Flp pilus assembly protein TadD
MRATPARRIRTTAVPQNTPRDPLATDPALARRLERLGLEFQARFHEIALRHRGEDPEILAELGHALTRLGRYQEGLAVDHRLVARAPDNPTVHYNLACSLCLCGQRAQALDALERSIELGYDDAEHLLGDEDLAELRQDARFQGLVARLT